MRTQRWNYAKGVVLGVVAATLSGGWPGAAHADRDVELTRITSLKQVGTPTGGRVGFTLHTLSTNKSTASEFIPWGFPVIEDTPPFNWSHKHDMPRSANPLDPNFGNSDTVGQHPHMQYFLYRCRPGDRKPVLIGTSDIKHGFKTADAAVGTNQMGHHLLGPGRSDPYGQGENARQVFYSPLSDDLLDRLTGTIASHSHFGTDTGMNVGGFEVYKRTAHAHADPIEHLLQAKVDDMDPDKNPNGTKWYLVGTYYVIGDKDAAVANDGFDKTNNTRWIEIVPPKVGANGFQGKTFGYGAQGFGLQNIPPCPPMGAGADARTQDGGSGLARLPLGGEVPTTLDFSQDIFEPSTFSYTKSILLNDTQRVSPLLIDFHGQIEFEPTHEDEPNLFLARFNQLEFTYEPFDLPGTSFTGIHREVLDPDGIFTGFLDTDQGFLLLEAPMRWLDFSNRTVATSLEYYQISFNPESSDLFHVTFESGGTFSVVPEPSTVALLGLGGLWLVAWQRPGRRRTRC